MKTAQAWGWLAAGILALGFNGIYHDGGAAWVHRAACQGMDRIAERAGPVLALATGRADLFVAKTETALARHETASCRIATFLARFQTKSSWTEKGPARFEAMSPREEAAQARLEADRARIEAQLSRVRVTPAMFDPSVCPRVRVNIPRVRISVPVVHDEAANAGPA